MTATSSETVFAYTVSSRREMISDLIESIKTLQNYVHEDKIFVYFTPPIRDQDLQEIRNLGVEVRKKSNYSDGFRMNDFNTKSHYADKLWVCEIDSENIVFLDCDTEVKGDILEEVKGDFDFKGRIGSSETLDKEWERLFQELGIEGEALHFNLGFFVMKNGFHKRIRDKWSKYLEEDFSDYDLAESYNKEQFAFACALTDTDNVGVEFMDKEQHGFGWSNENTEDSTVLHKGGSSKQNLIGKVLGSIYYRTGLDTRKVYEKLSEVAGF